MSTKFEFSEDPTGRLGSALVPTTKGGGVEVRDDTLVVEFGHPPVFGARIPLKQIVEATRVPDLTGKLKGSTRGVHGRSGRWLVNRSGRDLVRLRISPAVTADLLMSRLEVPESGSRLGRFITSKVLRNRVVNLRELTIGVEHPDSFLDAIRR